MKTNRTKQILLAFVIILVVTIASIIIILPQLTQPEETYVFDIVIEKMMQPVGIAHTNDERVFINERNGIIRILDKGRILPQPFLDISDRVNIEGNIEQGLLGLVFDPNYEENGFFYVTYTDSNFTVHLERFNVSEDPNIADKSSSTTLLSVEQTTAAHNGGHMRFGTDGYLYVSIGDGGESLDPNSTGQNKDDLLGKILRLDVSGDLPYQIPPDNPFVNDPSARPEIWLLGFRNPWQFSFAPDSDAMFIGEVGWSTYEEINYQPPNSPGGENYGWKLYEAETPIENTDSDATNTPDVNDLVFPIYYYPHSEPDDYDGSYPVGCAIIGGSVYRGEELPQLKGKYLYSDFCNGDLWTLEQQGDTWVTERLIDMNVRVTALGEDVNGEIYMTTFLGEVRRLKIDNREESAPDGDLDYDLVINELDNCPETGNPDQADNWGDVGVGDACDQNLYTNTAEGYEVKIFQQHYGAFHIYGCEGLNCGFVANIEVQDLSPDNPLIIESENFTGWEIVAQYVSESGKRAVYDVTISDNEGRVYVDNLQILISENSISWRTVS